ncbi:MAG: thymidine phosphorylase [Candidatus Cloacimonadota bacterium]|nr:MAG: thymidine phosphorylase [Candidatus Cloacimonadota bacterium]
MRAVDIIEKKKHAIELSREELEFLITGYVNEDIPDYQMSAFLMACCFQNLSAKETAYLTDIMRLSGDVMDFSDKIKGYTVDKHSTGGVGDKTTLVLGPLVAANGVVVAKMSGRGLGHTGGTLDKLESIEGLKIELEEQEFIDIANKVGIAVCGQTGNVVPADKKLYALRDVTSTVEDVALIAASIMSKKLALSNQGLVLDVKTGKGAFMKSLDASIKLAQRMVEIGTLMDRDVIGLVTDMDIPLGKTIGNALEVQEALETLQGNGPDDLIDLCAELGGRLLVLASKATDLEEGKSKILKSIADGSGLKKLEDMVVAQGGSLESLHNLKISKNIFELKSTKSGWVKSMDALSMGIAAMKLGAGRETKEADINLEVGLKLFKKVGDKVSEGETLLNIYFSDTSKLEEVKAQLLNSYSFSDSEVAQPKTILAEVLKDKVIKY